MSHSKERKEKNCLNCNAIVYGRYCHVCGQENTEPKDKFGHLVAHFISDIFHFDGMFFSAAKYLLFKPGFLTYEYLRGRRASYLNPIRMYVFISAIFFIFFLAVYKPENFFSDAKNQKVTVADVQEELNNKKQSVEFSLANKTLPSSLKSKYQQSLIKINADEALLKKDSSKKNEIHAAIVQDIMVTADTIMTPLEYDSIQHALPVNKRDNWLVQHLDKKGLSLLQQYKGREQTMLQNILEIFFHHFPQVLFVSLPLFALLLQLLYVRHKNLYYADHIIYTVHLYCAVYIFIFLLLVIGKLDDINHLEWLYYVGCITGLYILYYTYKALKNFYHQSAIKTFMKWLLLNCSAFVIMIFLFTIYFILSALML